MILSATPSHLENQHVWFRLGENVCFELRFLMLSSFNIKAESAWKDDFNNPNIKRETEDGVLKLWVREPTRMRGEQGAEKRTGLGHKRQLEDRCVALVDGSRES
jgi:hypothetical protein